MRAFFAMSLALLLFVTTAVAQDAVPWARSIEEAQQIAAQQNRLVLVHFYGDACPPCKVLDANVFPKPEFARALTANYVPVKINGNQNRALVAKYGIKQWPTDIVLTADGKVISGPMGCPKPGPNQTAQYQAVLDRIASNHFASQKPANTQVAQNVAYNQPMGGQSQPTQPGYGDKQPAPTNTTARDSRFASAATQPQPGQYQPQSSRYEAQPQQPAYQPDRRSSFVPPGGGGGAFVQGQDYREPVSNLPPRGQSQFGSQQPMGEGDPAMAARPKQSQTDDPMYGSNANQQPGHTGYGKDARAYDPQYSGGNTAGYRPAQADVAKDPRTYDSQYATGNPAGTNMREPAPQPQWQNNPNVAVAPPRGNPNPNIEVAVPAREPVPQPVAANTPPVCLEGYCPVALIEGTKWVKGDVRFGAIHRGRTYLFGTQADQQKFLANPDKFSPMLSGFDPVKFTEQGALVEGKRQHGIVHKDHMYLFADEASLERFCKAPDSYAAPVQQAMGNAPTRR
jgi:YHS domain-containing protein